MVKLNIIHQKHFRKCLVGGCIPLILNPVPGHNLRKPSKECGVFQSLGTINFVLFFIKKQSQKGGGGMAQCPPEYAPAAKIFLNCT